MTNFVSDNRGDLQSVLGDEGKGDLESVLHTAETEEALEDSIIQEDVDLDISTHSSISGQKTYDYDSRVAGELSDYGCGHVPEGLPEGSIALLQDYFGGPHLDEKYVEELPLLATDAEIEGRPLLDDPIETLLAKEDATQYNVPIKGNACGCQRNCFEQFEEGSIQQSHLDCLEQDEYCNLHINHQHLVIIGALNTLTRTEPTTQRKNQKQTNRLQSQTEFRFRGIPVCRTFFQYVFGTGKKRLENVKKNFVTQGIVPRKHLNVTKTTKARALPFEQRSAVVNFIDKYATQHALVLPGRLPSYRNFDLKILPCSMNKKFLYDKYHLACQAKEMPPVTIASWYVTWSTLCPNIVIQKPRTDLCSQCQKNVTSLSRMGGLSEQEKQHTLQKSMEHLTIIQRERSEYKSSIAECKHQLQLHFPGAQPNPHNPCSFKGTMHYSFDYAQQVHLPFSSQQVGPIYFLTGYKVGLFGVALEPLGKFVLYIIPEACVTAKGSNTVISLLHHFFENFGLGEEVVHCHADNCSGQNKNNYLMQYGIWRTLTGLHKEFHVSCLPVGHTKFTPDLFFGLFKNHFRRSDANCLADITAIATAACPIAKSIIPCLVGNEDGVTFVTCYDWQALFANFKCTKIANLLQYQHFDVKDDSGNISCRRGSDDLNPVVTKVFKSDSKIDPQTLPPILKPEGLSYMRKKYLFEKIREFVHDDSKDILCPQPHSEPQASVEKIPVPMSRLETSKKVRPPTEANVQQPMEVKHTSPQPGTSSASASLSKKAPRKPITCGYCGEIGHRNQVVKGVPSCKKRELENPSGKQ